MGKIGHVIRIFKNSTLLRHILCTVKCVYFKSSAWWVWKVVHTGVTIVVKLWIHPSSQNSLCPSSVSSPDSLAPGNYWSAFSRLRLDLSFLEFQSNGHPLSSPSPPAPNPSQHQSLFHWIKSSHEVARVLEFQHQSFQRNPRADLLQNGLVGSPCSPRDSLKSLFQHHSSKASIFRCSAFFIVQLSHPYMTTGKIIALTRWTFVGKCLCFLICCLGWS